MITLVPGFDPVPDSEPLVLATCTQDHSTVELVRYPAGPFAVREYDNGELKSEETFDDEVIASLAYNKATDDAWADWVGELTDMARHAHEQQLEQLAVAIDLLGVMAVAEECAS